MKKILLYYKSYIFRIYKLFLIKYPKYSHKSWEVYFNKKKKNKLNEPKNSLIEITNACNLNCIMCNTKNSTRKVGHISISLFEKIIKELKKIKISYVGLHMAGETFMQPNLDELISIASKNGIQPLISTNGQFPEKIEKLYENFPKIVKLIRFSIDGAKKDTYEYIRRGGKFEKIIESLELVKKINKNKRNFNINISIDSILSLTNIYEIPFFFKNYGKYCFPEQINFSLVSGHSPDQKYFREAFPFKYLITNQVPCSMPFSDIYFTYSGNVTLCCLDFNEDLVIGNISDSTILDLWESEKASKIRRMHNFEEPMDISSCKKCYAPYGRISKLINDYIHFSRTKKEDAFFKDDFGKKLTDILWSLNDILKEKDYLKLTEFTNCMFK